MSKSLGQLLTAGHASHASTVVMLLWISVSINHFTPASAGRADGPSVPEGARKEGGDTLSMQTPDFSITNETQSLTQQEGTDAKDAGKVDDAMPASLLGKMLTPSPPPVNDTLSLLEDQPMKSENAAQLDHDGFCPTFTFGGGQGEGKAVARLDKEFLMVKLFYAEHLPSGGGIFYEDHPDLYIEFTVDQEDNKGVKAQSRVVMNSYNPLFGSTCWFPFGGEADVQMTLWEKDTASSTEVGYIGMTKGKGISLGKPFWDNCNVDVRKTDQQGNIILNPKDAFVVQKEELTKHKLIKAFLSGEGIDPEKADPVEEPSLKDGDDKKWDSVLVESGKDRVVLSRADLKEIGLNPVLEKMEKECAKKFSVYKDGDKVMGKDGLPTSVTVAFKVVDPLVKSNFGVEKAVADMEMEDAESGSSLSQANKAAGKAHDSEQGDADSTSLSQANKAAGKAHDSKTGDSDGNCPIWSVGGNNPNLPMPEKLLFFKVIKVLNLPNGGGWFTRDDPDLYVKFGVQETKMMGQTGWVKDDYNPIFKYGCYFPFSGATKLRVELWDHDDPALLILPSGDDLLGYADVLMDLNFPCTTKVDEDEVVENECYVFFNVVQKKDGEEQMMVGDSGEQTKVYAALKFVRTYPKGRLSVPFTLGM